MPDALNAFVGQSGTQAQTDADTLSGVDRNTMDGDLSAGEALGRLLSGTGVGLSRNDAGAFVIEQAAAEADEDGELAIDMPQVEADATGAPGPMRPRSTGRTRRFITRSFAEQPRVSSTRSSWRWPWRADRLHRS